MSALAVPAIGPDADTLGAALAYAEAGWYVLPVLPSTKHAGSVLGKGWPAKSSRDLKVIASWFAGTDYALALHVGRSGAVAFDVDDPTKLPDLLTKALAGTPCPHQSTRTDTPGRGHYVYAVPAGRHLGNGKGRTLAGGWGEVRGANGIIVAAPSEHAKADGRYAWLTTGTVPELPVELSEVMPDGTHADDSASDDDVRAFLAEHTAAERPGLLTAILAAFAGKVEAGESRHEAAVSCTPWAMREAAAGYFPAQDAADKLRDAFASAIGTDRNARDEFTGILAWSVAQARATDPADTRRKIEDAFPPPPPESEHQDDDVIGRRYPPVDWVKAFAQAKAEPEWLCKPLLEKGKSVALYSVYKQGKSLLLLEIAAALAMGRAVLGNPARPPIRVLYFDHEKVID